MGVSALKFSNNTYVISFDRHTALLTRRKQINFFLAQADCQW